MVLDQISPLANQVLFPVGLLPLLVWTAARREVTRADGRHRGMMFAVLTGLLGGIGNLVFYEALARGGKVSLVVPLTSLFPMVTVAAATCILKEMPNRQQWAGVIFALAAIWFLTS